MNFANFNSTQRNVPGNRFIARAFTILELLLVVTIIGFMAAMALPHLSGFTKSNSMTAATRQMLDDIAHARQLAMVNRAKVCMVFLPGNFWTNDSENALVGGGTWTNPEINTLYSHEYAAYAFIALRSVGDQPGRANVHYLFDGNWQYLPQGVYIHPFQFTNTILPPLLVSTTNTTINLSNGFYVGTLPTTNNFPFPSTFDSNINYSLPYICFTPGGGLATNTDQFIMLTRGSLLYTYYTNGNPTFTPPNISETPPGNCSNNANLIHIDAVTGRAKLERNQF